MLRLALKKDDRIKIGDEITIISMSEGRVSLAVDAPRELRINRVEAPKLEEQTSSDGKTSSDKSEKYVKILG